MGTLLNRRRYMGGKALPYDAEIEYLESTGTQWIDSGVKFASGLRVTCDALYTERFTTTQILFAPSASGACWCGNVNNKRWGISGAGYGNSSVKTHVEVFYDKTTTTLFLEGVQVSHLPRYANPSTNVGIFAEATSQGYKSSARIYEVVIQDVGDNNLFWGIPVRVGTTGYMYDKVSKQLFGNDGTNDFVLGPDKT